MIRKFWMDVRPMFLLSTLILFLITGIYSWSFATSSIFEYHEDLEAGLYINPGEDVTKLQQEHPTGRLFSLKEAPDSYLVGFNALTRFVFTWLVLCLCAGGILTESSTGTTSFDLSLPLTRTEWVWRRASLLLGLTLLLALLDCALAAGFNLWMGLTQNVGWLMLSAIQLCLVSVPVIGLSLCVQSWFSGRFSDPTLLGVGPLAVTTIAVLGVQIPGYFLSSINPIEWIAFVGYGRTLPATNPWIGLAVALTCGVGGVLVAAWRFKRVDF